MRTRSSSARGSGMAEAPAVEQTWMGGDAMKTTWPPAGVSRLVPMVRLAREGSTWRIGTEAQVAWIANSTSTGRTITAAIPPGFEAYATVILPYGGHGQDTHDRAVLALLSEQSPGQRWWLGYLDTGADDIVFPGAPMVNFVRGMALRAGRGWARAGRHLAAQRPLVVLERRLAQLDVPRRPLLAGVDAVG